QAEDGIRDFHVTGVQTCALPILPAMSASKTRSRLAGINPRPASSFVASLLPPKMSWSMLAAGRAAPVFSALATEPRWCTVIWTQIGRASCRERVEDGEVDESGRK